jgi:hypothetical protein
MARHDRQRADDDVPHRSAGSRCDFVVGSRLARRFSERRFQRLVFVLLLASGVTLLLPVLLKAAHPLFS